MHIARTYNYFFALVLIAIYLALPAINLSEAAPCATGAASVQAVSSASAIPCDDCPCSDGRNGECCDSVFCSCACHAPLGAGLQLRYAPMVFKQLYQEPSWYLPQVYSSIFVPPQNAA